jgi:phosphoglycolate phosphatase-like HAD superfamily hydrolase
MNYPPDQLTTVLSLDQPTSPVQHVFFDWNGVLYDDSAWRRWLLSLLTRVGLHTHYSAFFRVWDREFQPAVLTGECEFGEAMRQFLLASGLTRPQVEEVLASTRHKLRCFEQKIRPFPGVSATINQLIHGGVNLSIVSRWPCPRPEIEARLGRMGLSSRLTDLATATRSRFANDAGAYYRAVIENKQCRPADVAYVGRDPDDLAAVSRVGMLAIAFNYDADAVADLYLDQFDQLVRVIGSPRRLLAAG